MSLTAHSVVAVAAKIVFTRRPMLFRSQNECRLFFRNGFRSLTKTRTGGELHFAVFFIEYLVVETFCWIFCSSECSFTRLRSIAMAWRDRSALEIAWSERVMTKELIVCRFSTLLSGNFSPSVCYLHEALMFARMTEWPSTVIESWQTNNQLIHCCSFAIVMHSYLAK